MTVALLLLVEIPNVGPKEQERPVDFLRRRKLEGYQDP